MYIYIYTSTFQGVPMKPLKHGKLAPFRNRLAPEMEGLGIYVYIYICIYFIHFPRLGHHLHLPGSPPQKKQECPPFKRTDFWYEEPMNFPDPLRSALTEQTPEERWKKTTTFTAAIYNLLWPVGFCKRMRDEIDFHARIGIRIGKSIPRHPNCYCRCQRTSKHLLRFSF